MVSVNISPQRESSMRATHLCTSIHQSSFVIWRQLALDKDTKSHDLPRPCPLPSLQAVLPLTLALPAAGTVLLAAGLSLLPPVLPGVGWGAPAFTYFFYFFLSLQNARLAAGLASHLSQAGMKPGSLSVLRLSTGSGPLEHEGHIFGTSLCPLYLTLH